MKQLKMIVIGARQLLGVVKSCIREPNPSLIRFLEVTEGFLEEATFKMTPATGGEVSMAEGIHK